MKEFLSGKLQCPNCKIELTQQDVNLFCPQCHSVFLFKNNCLLFLNSEALEIDKESNNIRDYFKRWPRFYYFVMIVFGPGLFTGLSANKFVKKFSSLGVTVNLGSGPRKIDDVVINLDLFPYKDVDVVADIEKLPFKNGSVYRIICDNVLEHVKNPEAVIAEIYRVLPSGGMAYFCVPFMHPFHSSPADFTRWTQEGLVNLFKAFEVVEKGVRIGPFSALTIQLCYITALTLSFNNEILYWLWVNLSMFIFFPIKLLDLIFSRFRRASDSAAILYFVVKKK